MDSLTSTQQKFKLTAGILGVIQSLTWIILALICIILVATGGTSYGHSHIPFNSYMSEIQYLMAELFINGNAFLNYDDYTMQPTIFCIFMVIYLVVDLYWIAISLTVLFRRSSKLRLYLKYWTFVTWTVCVLDFITVVILGSDYDKCVNSVGNSVVYLPLTDLNVVQVVVIQSFCANGFLPVLVIAAKGFVLWIVNLVLSLVLWKISKGPKQIENSNNQQLAFLNVQVLPNTVAASHFQPVVQNYQPSVAQNQQVLSGYPSSGVPVAPISHTSLVVVPTSPDTASYQYSGIANRQSWSGNEQSGVPSAPNSLTSPLAGPTSPNQRLWTAYTPNYHASRQSWSGNTSSTANSPHNGQAARASQLQQSSQRPFVLAPRRRY